MPCNKETIEFLISLQLKATFLEVVQSPVGMANVNALGIMIVKMVIVKSSRIVALFLANIVARAKVKDVHLHAIHPKGSVAVLVRMRQLKISLNWIHAIEMKIIIISNVVVKF